MIQHVRRPAPVRLSTPFRARAAAATVSRTDPRCALLAGSASLLALALLITTRPAQAHEGHEPQAAPFRFEEVTDAWLPVETRASMDIAAVDLDGDGRLDLVLPQEFLTNVVLMNRGDRFERVELLPALADDELTAGPPQLQGPGKGHDSEDVSVADFDGDGRLDVIIVSEDDVKFGRANVHEYYRGTAGGFERVRDILPDTEADAVTHGDVDGDGRLDLLLSGAGQDRLLIGDGRGGFADETDARLPHEAATTQDGQFADLDGDGDLDIVLGHEGGHSVWINDGRGRFSSETKSRLPPSGLVEARKVTPADVDGDGDLDLYFSHVAWQGRQGQDRLMINDGTGRFTDDSAARIPVEADTTLDAVFADLDGDGDLDLVRGQTGPLTVWLNDGAGRFSDVTASVFAEPVVGQAISIELADFNGDGVLDIYAGQLKGGPQGPEGIRDRLFVGRGPGG